MSSILKKSIQYLAVLGAAVPVLAGEADADPTAKLREACASYDTSWMADCLEGIDAYATASLSGLREHCLAESAMPDFSGENLDSLVAAYLDRRLVAHLADCEDVPTRLVKLEWLHLFFAPALLKAFEAQHPHKRYLPGTEVYKTYQRIKRRREGLRVWNKFLLERHCALGGTPKELLETHEVAVLKELFGQAHLGEEALSSYTSSNKWTWIAGVLFGGYILSRLTGTDAPDEEATYYE